MISRGNSRKALCFVFITMLIITLIISVSPSSVLAFKSDGVSVISSYSADLTETSDDSDEIIVVFNKSNVKNISVIDESDITVSAESENNDISDEITATDTVVTETSKHTISRKKKSSRIVSERRSVSSKVDLITPAEDIDTDELIDILNDDPNVLCAGRNFTRQLSAVPNDSYYSSQWWFSSVGADKTWNQVNSSNTVVVAVIDTGLNTSHADLQNRYVQGYDYVTKSTNVTDLRGHGTQVSSCIAATANNLKGIAGVSGIADIKIAPYRVGGLSSTDNSLNGSYIVAALYAAADRPEVRVINMSYGGYYNNPYIFTLPPESVLDGDMEYQAIKYAASKGKVLIAAAGNEGGTDGFRGAYSYPASFSDVISVSAINSSNLWSSFSQYNSEVELCAPGQNIATLSLNGEYTTSSGTSFSSPIVAGCAAVLIADYPSLTAPQVRSILSSTAQNLGDKKYFGNGKVRIDLALSASRNTFGNDSSSAIPPAANLNPENPPAANPDPVLPPADPNPVLPPIISYQPNKLPATGIKGSKIEVQTMAGSVSQTVTSSNGKVIKISDNKILEFAGAGKATVKVTYKLANSKVKTISKSIKIISKVTGIKLNQDTVTIAKKKKVSLKATIEPADSTNKAVVWSVYPKGIATVSSKGVVTGIKAGTCTVKATTKDGGKIATASITVTPIYETSIKLNKTKVSLKKGKTFQLKATLLPSATDFKSVTWVSDNTDVASIDVKGRIKAMSAGTCTITATSANGKSTACTVTVLP